jgi:LysM repeat protein
MAKKGRSPRHAQAPIHCYRPNVLGYSPEFPPRFEMKRIPSVAHHSHEGGSQGTEHIPPIANKTVRWPHHRFNRWVSPPEAEMEKYIVKRGDTLSGIASRLKISVRVLIAANRRIKDPNKIFVGQFLNLPVEARHPVGSPAGPTIGEVLGKGAIPIDGSPASDPRFVQKAIIAVGIPIWGGAFALYRKVVNERGTDAIMLTRSEVHLSDDPLKSSSLRRSHALAPASMRVPHPVVSKRSILLPGKQAR